MIACGNTEHDEDDTQFRGDVIQCEEAVARLERCCGATFNANVVECRHYYAKDTGCNQTTIDKIDPAFTLDESKCIQDTACDQIVSSNMCARAAAAGAARITKYQSNDNTITSSSSTTSTTGGSAATNAPVCP